MVESENGRKSVVILIDRLAGNEREFRYTNTNLKFIHSRTLLR